MASAPRIAASFVTSVLDAAARFDPALGDRLRARLSPATRSALEVASAIAFVPVELDVEVTECLFAEAGEERAREVMRRNLADTFEAPFLGAFVSAAMRLLGRAPGRLFGWSAKIWGQLYRDAGSMRFESDGPNAGRLEFEGLPPCIARSHAYLIGMEAAFGAAFELMEVAGEARLGAIDAAQGRVTYHIDWKG